MAYELLSKYYYKLDAQSYQNVLAARYEQENTLQIDFPALSDTCFCVKTEELYALLLEIHKIDKNILKLRRILPIIAINEFTHRCLIDEIFLTNSIEGVHSTRRDIDALLTAPDNNKKRSRLQGLAQKYKKLQEQEVVQLFTCEDIRNLYDELVLTEVLEEDSNDAPDGKLFRKGPVSVYSAADKEIHRGIMPEAAIEDAMKKALLFLDNEQEDLLIRIAVFHYLLGFIHPFYNGNGRLDRFISSYLLTQELDPLLSYRISYTIKEHINEYYKAFKECNRPENHGDTTPFVIFFIKIVHESIVQLHAALEKRVQKLSYYENILQQNVFGTSGEINQLIYVLVQAQLFSEQGVSTKTLLEHCGLSRVTLMKRLDVIEDFGLLRVQKIGKEKYYGLVLENLAKGAET